MKIFVRNWLVVIMDRILFAAFLITWIILVNAIAALEVATVEHIQLNDGETASIPCVFEGDIKSVEWRKNETSLNSTIVAVVAFGEKSGEGLNHGFQITDEGTLIIEAMSYRHVGTYTCEALNTDYEHGRVRTTISLRDSLPQALTTSTRLPVNIFKNEMGTIPCSFRGEANVFLWRKEFKSVTAEVVASLMFGKRREPIGGYGINDDGTLVIQKMDMAHEGAYVCEWYNTKNEHGSLAADVSLLVEPLEPYPSIVECLPQRSCNMSFAPHQQQRYIELTCRVSGSRPHATLEWTSTTKETLLYSVNHIPDPGKGTVTTVAKLKHAWPAEEGKFICSASGKSIATHEAKEATFSYNIYSAQGRYRENLLSFIVYGLLSGASLIVSFVLFRRCKAYLKRKNSGNYADKQTYATSKRQHRQGSFRRKSRSGGYENVVQVPEDGKELLEQGDVISVLLDEETVTVILDQRENGNDLAICEIKRDTKNKRLLGHPLIFEEDENYPVCFAQDQNDEITFILGVGIKIYVLTTTDVIDEIVLHEPPHKYITSLFSYGKKWKIILLTFENSPYIYVYRFKTAKLLLKIDVGNICRNPQLRAFSNGVYALTQPSDSKVDFIKYQNGKLTPLKTITECSNLNKSMYPNCILQTGSGWLIAWVVLNEDGEGVSWKLLKYDNDFQAETIERERTSLEKGVPVAIRKFLLEIVVVYSDMSFEIINIKQSNENDDLKLYFDFDVGPRKRVRTASTDDFSGDSATES